MDESATAPGRRQWVKVVTVCDTQCVADVLSTASPRRTATSGQVGASDQRPVRHCHSCHRAPQGNTALQTVRASQSEQWHGASSYATAAASCNGDRAPQRPRIAHARASSKVRAASAARTGGTTSCRYRGGAPPAHCGKEAAHTSYRRTAGQPSANIDGKRRFAYKGSACKRSRESMWRAHVCELASAGVAIRLFDGRTCVALAHWLQSGLAPAALRDDERAYCQAHFASGYAAPTLRHYMDVIMHGDQWTAEVAMRSAATWRNGDGPLPVNAASAVRQQRATADKATQCDMRRRPQFLMSRSTQTD